MSPSGISNFELTSTGVVLRGPLGSSDEAAWSAVFGAVVVGRCAYVLCERQVPSPPWLSAAATSDEHMEVLQSVVTVVRARVQERGYRQAKLQPMPRPELEARILRGEHVPGALEVPIGPGPGRLSRLAQRTTLAGVSATAVGLVGGIAAGAFTALGAIGLGVVLPHLRGKRAKRGRRVLVLTPHGCVVGLPGGPSAFGYDEVGGFELVYSNARAMKMSDARAASLRIKGPNGESIGLLDGRWFGAPLPLIVAVAEAYRRRHLV